MHRDQWRVGSWEDGVHQTDFAVPCCYQWETFLDRATGIQCQLKYIKPFESFTNSNQIRSRLPLTYTIIVLKQENNPS